jgi:hypothetical protein
VISDEREKACDKKFSARRCRITSRDVFSLMRRKFARMIQRKAVLDYVPSRFLNDEAKVARMIQRKRYRFTVEGIYVHREGLCG